MPSPLIGKQFELPLYRHPLTIQLLIYEWFFLSNGALCQSDFQISIVTKLQIIDSLILELNLARISTCFDDNVINQLAVITVITHIDARVYFAVAHGLIGGQAFFPSFWIVPDIIVNYSGLLPFGQNSWIFISLQRG